jgi:hypothetical protein
MEDVSMPLPTEESTPPVMKIYFTMVLPAITEHRRHLSLLTLSATHGCPRKYVRVSVDDALGNTKTFVAGFCCVVDDGELSLVSTTTLLWVVAESNFQKKKANNA